MMIEDYMEQEPDKPESEKSMECFMSWYNGNKFKFNAPEIKVYRDDDGKEIISDAPKITFLGYNTDPVVIQVFTNELKTVIEKAGFRHSSVLTKWKEAGYIRVKGNKNVSQKKFAPEHKNVMGKQNFTCVEIFKDKVKHLIDDGDSNVPTNSIVEDFCKAIIYREESINPITLNEIHDSYCDWCEVNEVKPVNMITLFGKIIARFPNNPYDQDGNSINGIIFQGLNVRNVPTPIKIPKFIPTISEDVKV